MAITQISTAGIENDAVTSGKIPANAVGASELADNAVDTAAIADQAVTLAKLPHGTGSNDGKFLRANNGADPTFETVTGTTINNNADNRVITGSGTANTLEGEANLTFNGEKVLLINTAGSSPSDRGFQIEASHTLSDGDFLPALNFNPNNSNTHRTRAAISGVSHNGTAGMHLAFLTRHAADGTQLSTSDEKMRLDTSGNVGIGTTSPGSKLHVADTNPVIGQFHHSDGGTNDEARISLGALSSNPPSQRGVNIVGQNNGAGHDFIVQCSASHSAGPSEKMRINSSGNVCIGTTSPAAKLHLDTSHYVVSSSGKSTTGIHLDGTHGNAGEYGGGISFGCGGTGSAAIAARQATSSQHVVGMSFFTHDSSTSSDNAVEKVRIHDGGATSFNNGVCLGNGLTYSASHQLDDYEEGTFVATVVGGSSVTQTFDQTGRYTKIGRFVHVQGLAQFSGVGNGSTVFMSLPFNHVSSTALGGGVISFTNVSGLSGQSTLTLVGQSGQAKARVKNKTSDPTISGTQSNRAIYYHFSYEAA